MLRIRFGQVEKHVPSAYCKKFNYRESSVSYPTEAIRFKDYPEGCLIELPFSSQENFYGGGLQMYSFNHKGRKLMLRANSDPVAPTGDSHAPVPFFVSTQGYGIYIDTARYAEISFGVQKSGADNAKDTSGALQDSTDALYATRTDGERVISVWIPYAHGVDLYIMEGKTILDVVCQYNMLSGGGPENVPDYLFGTCYRCNTKSTAREIINMIRYMDSHDLPVSVIGIEPGWHTHAYSCTYVWDEGRFPKQDREELFTLCREKGIHLNLWQHCFVHPDSPIFDEIARAGCGSYRVWNGLIPDFTIPEVRQIFGDFQNANVVNDVVDSFKLDECDGSDYARDWSFPNGTRFPNGMSGDVAHNLLGTLYMRTMTENALKDRPTFGEVRNAHALCASYPFALYSDLYSQDAFIRGCVNAGFSGILWNPELRDAKQGGAEELIRRLQNTVFSVRTCINAWYCGKAPWLDLDCEDAVRNMLKLRLSLKDDLAKAMKKYHEEGKPPMRALVCDYTDDPETYGIDDEYLFCEDMLVAPVKAGEMQRRVYLPKGQWETLDGRFVDRCGWIDYVCRDIEDYPVFRRIEE